MMERSFPRFSISAGSSVSWLFLEEQRVDG